MSSKMSSFGTPKASLLVAGRQLRRRLIITDAVLTSGITASPAHWEEPCRSSPSLFDDTSCTPVMPDTQLTSTLQSIVVTPSSSSVIPESQLESQPLLDSITFVSSPGSASSLLPYSSESPPLVTSAMLPPPDDISTIHAKTVSELFQANLKISDMLIEIKELKNHLSAAVAVQTLAPTTSIVQRKPLKHCKDANEEMLLFRASGRFQVLSNFYPCNLRMFGEQFSSAEHAYQYRKATFHNRRDIAVRVLRARTAYKAKADVKCLTQSEAWHECKTDIMKNILEEKAKQCPVFRRALLNTGSKRLIHNTETDSFWGCGEDFKGGNALGCLLQDLRLSLAYELPKPNVTQQKATQLQKLPPPTVVKVPIADKAPAIARAPSAASPRVLVLGNSNSRGIAQGLLDRGIDSCGFTMPGGTISHITSRVKYVKSQQTPDFVLLMAGDIEAADGLPAEKICARVEHLVKETRQQFPWSRVILSGLPQAGDNSRQNTLRKVNAFLETIAIDDRLVEYIDNSRARLRDNIHLSNVSKEKLCFNVSCIVKKFSL